MCTACEASQTPLKDKDKGKSKGKHKHKPMHGLVLCQPPREALKAETETQHSAWLGALEAKFDEMQRAATGRLATLETKIDKLALAVGGSESASNSNSDRSGEGRFEERLDALDGKMQKIEDMLGVLLTKLG